MRLETEQMAAVYGRTDHRQGSTPSGPSFTTQLSRMANEANNRLALALDNESKAQAEKVKALAEQQEVMRALAAVVPDDQECTRGQTLARRARA